MNQTTHEHLLRTFFECDPGAITGIFSEFIHALTAGDSLPPVAQMEQNYETARANPEIQMLPGNLKDARDTVFPYFWGTDSWSSPLHLENVKGPANNASLVGALACLLKNPNLCTDTYSQRSNELEVKAVTALANLLFYHTDDPWGVFTMGGTISNLYGARIGIEKVLPGAMRNGLGGQRVVGIVSAAAHYSNRSVAGWLGMGTANLIPVPTDGNIAIRLDALAETLDHCYSQGAKVAFVTATFGTTDSSGIDDIGGMRAVMEEASAKHGVPMPQLHVDAAVGWALSFFAEYDLAGNPLDFPESLLPLVSRARQHALGLRGADSITIDFHKMGWGHYPGSAFIVNHRSDLRHLARDVSETPYFSEADGRRDPALFTLECSRPALGPYTVMASLNAIGMTGWQMLIARSLELAQRLKDRIEALPNCKVLNPGTTGPAVVWWVLPKGRDAKEIFARMEAGNLPPEEFAGYAAEIRRLFDKRNQAMDPARDARLSFTTEIGYRPGGIDLPAWKAVLFNPRTTGEIVDRLAQGIAELV